MAPGRSLRSSCGVIEPCLCDPKSLLSIPALHGTITGQNVLSDRKPVLLVRLAPFLVQATLYIWGCLLFVENRNGTVVGKAVVEVLAGGELGDIVRGGCGADGVLLSCFFHCSCFKLRFYSKLIFCNARNNVLMCSPIHRDSKGNSLLYIFSYEI